MPRVHQEYEEDTLEVCVEMRTAFTLSLGHRASTCVFFSCICWFLQSLHGLRVSLCESQSNGSVGRGPANQSAPPAPGFNSAPLESLNIPNVILLWKIKKDFQVSEFRKLRLKASE